MSPPATGAPRHFDITSTIGHRPVFPSIGSERKTYFPIRRGFFDPGVCSRVGWAFSS